MDMKQPAAAKDEREEGVKPDKLKLSKETLKDMAAGEAQQIKGGVRKTADPDDGGE